MESALRSAAAHGVCAFQALLVTKHEWYVTCMVSLLYNFEAYITSEVMHDICENPIQLQHSIFSLTNNPCKNRMVIYRQMFTHILR